MAEQEQVNLSAIAQRATRLMARCMQRTSTAGASAPTDELGLGKAFSALSSCLLNSPFRLVEAQAKWMTDYAALWQYSALKMMGFPSSQPAATAEKTDKRFMDPDWENHFLFDLVKQYYLITARHLQQVVADVEGLDAATQRKVDFFTRQYIDALSPSNFLLTNPEVLRETAQSGGQNLLKGFDNLLRDMESGDGRLNVRMTDPEAFELGRNIATTPGKVVFQNALMQLIQYAPTTPKQFKKPLLIVPPWINKFYILDLRAENSYVRWATDQGHTTFIISWVNPDARHAGKDFEDYLLEGALAAIDAIGQATGEKRVNLVSYCLGGTLLMATLAYMSARKDRRVASATFFTSLIDFSEPGELGVFLDESTVAGVEKKMAERGFLEGRDMAATFNMLRANDLIWPFVVNNYLLGKASSALDMLYWNADSTRMPAKMHSFYLRNFYLDNKLCQPGGIELAGVAIDVSQVKTPCYFVSTINDHIAPWKSTYRGALLPRGPVTFVLGGSGHIAGIINPPAADKYGYWTNDALPAAADDFLAGAMQNAGSWWPHWQQWVSVHAGARVAARQPGAGKLDVIEEAPGAYVKTRADKSA